MNAKDGAVVKKIGKLKGILGVKGNGE